MTHFYSIKKCFSNISNFSNECGEESYITIDTRFGLTFDESIKALMDEYKNLLSDNGLSRDTEIYIRFFLSDISNQTQHIRKLLEKRSSLSFYSFIGQPPVDNSKVSLLAYHIKGKKNIIKEKVSENILQISHGEYSSLWIKNNSASHLTSYEQSSDIFDNFSNDLNKMGGNILEHALRTWIYVRDIDVNYYGMVDARKNLFETVGLTPDTHYITSTGIEARNEKANHIVHLDSLSMLGQKKEQIEYLTAPDNMCSTIDYGVTFERGTKVYFGDRSHYHIAGTASIDNQGKILHIGNVQKQTERAIENVDQLLRGAGATLDNIQFLTIYLRDPSDHSHVMAAVNDIFNDFGSIPVNFVTGAVCRPQWLVEVEGVACTANREKRFSPFC